jgi:hypothetical protein
VREVGEGNPVSSHQLHRSAVALSFMKRSKMKKRIGVGAISLLLLGCNKEALPPLTYEGKNVFACRINGKTFVTQGKSGGILNFGGIRCIFNRSDSGVILSAQLQKPRHDFSFRFKYMGTTFPSTITDDYPYRAYYYDYSGGSALPGSGTTYQTDSTHSGTLTITYYDGKVLAGIFEIDMVNGNGELVHITDGRFDVSLQ